MSINYYCALLHYIVRSGNRYTAFLRLSGLAKVDILMWEKRLAHEVNTDSIQDDSQGHQQTSLTKALWRCFSEMKTAIVLLLLLALISILGTVIKQNATPQEYLAAYGARNYAIIKYLGLTNVYDSGFYRLVLALVGINLAVCSINRFGVTWRRTFQPKLQADAGLIAKMPRSETLNFAGTLDGVAPKLTAAMRSGSYRVTECRESNDVVVFAAKGRLGLWGPYLTHVSLLVIFLGAILGNILGFNGYTAITEGGYTKTYFSNQKESNLDFRVALRKFKIGHDVKHNPTAYRSDLAVYEGDKLAAQKVIDVNHPLTYKGVSFYQSDYGLSGLVLKITAPSGETTRMKFDLATENGPYGKTFGVSGQPFKDVRIGGKRLTVFVHNLVADYDGKSEMGASALPINPAIKLMINDRLPEYKGLDAWSKLGWLEVGKSAPYKDFTVTLDDVVNYTGLQVARNPGLPIIYLGFGLLLAGVFLSFYVPYRVMRLRISATGQGVTAVVGASSRDDYSVFDADFKRLRDAVA